MDTANAPTQTMRSVGYFEATEAKKLQVGQHFPRPVPKDDEVLIEVHAAGLNFADVLARRGLYPDAPSYPYIPGYEVAGVIVQIGDAAVRDGFQLKVGDKVLAFTLFGGYAEYAVARHVGVFALPENMSYEEGASLPVNLATAYHCLFHTGTLLPGDRVLIHGAAGGVGQVAVQMAKLAGCEVFVTAGSTEKLDMLRDRYAADHCINYLTSNVSAEVRRIVKEAQTNQNPISAASVGSGATSSSDQKVGGYLDVILDPIGGSQLKSGIGLLRPNGRVVCYGVSSLSERGSFSGFFSALPNVFSMLTFNTIDLLQRSKSFVGVNMLAIAKDRPDILRLSVSKALDLIHDGKLRTVVSKVFDFNEVGQAQLDMETRKTTGKVVFRLRNPENEQEPNNTI